jgi:ribosomal protein S18 acetylase RimI-like enzyme
MSVTLRPESPQGDEPFLRRLIVETVSLELGAAAWPEPMRSQLLGIQYAARRKSRMNFPDAVSHIIQAYGVDAGWAVVAVTARHVHLVEIMILPELRGKGIGTAVLAEVAGNAAVANKPVRLEVNPVNHSAIRLYERLGFRIVGQDDTHYTMEKDCVVPES